MRGQRARNLHAPAFAARQRDGRRVAHMGDAELGHQFFDHRLQAPGSGSTSSAVARMFLFGGEAAEDRGFLRQIADAQPRAAIHRQFRDVMAVEFDRAVIGGDEPGDHVEAGRLAGAVGSQQPTTSPRRKRQAHGAHHGPLAEALADTSHHETLAAFDHTRDTRIPCPVCLRRYSH
jgi:hypothetical protein